MPTARGPPAYPCIDRSTSRGLSSTRFVGPRTRRHRIFDGTSQSGGKLEVQFAVVVVTSPVVMDRLLVLSHVPMVSVANRCPARRHAEPPRPAHLYLTPPVVGRVLQPEIPCSSEWHPRPSLSRPNRR